MRTLKLVVAYDGTDYSGWQMQPNGPSIQSELETAFARVTGIPSRPVASGRTDAGVHALGQVAHVRTPSTLPTATLTKALNANLPPAIVVRDIEEVAADFDATRDARWKLYRYVFHDGPIPDVFLLRYCWKVRHRLDVEKMATAVAVLEGTHDFRCFESHWPNRLSSVRTLRRCTMSRLGDVLHLDVDGDGFLYNMVRAIAGTLFEIGRGKWPVSAMGDILTDGARRRAGPTAPAQGLFLVRVEY